MDKSNIAEAVAGIQPIMLPDISAVRFMNRTDSKYLLPASLIPDLLKMLDRRYSVLDINNTRILPYSTLYFDTPEYLLFYQHIRNKALRYKLRYRKYESSGDVFLEIKRKTLNNRTVKQRIPTLAISESFDSESLGFLERNFPYPIQDFTPALANSFSRITIAGIETRERVTIDYNIGFSDPRSGSSGDMNYLSVVELKREGLALESPLHLILRDLGSYQSGFSKYVMGLALLNERFRKNAVKLKFIKLKRIENDQSI